MKIKCPLLLIMLVISSLVAAQNAAPPFQIKGVLLDSLYGAQNETYIED